MDHEKMSDAFSEGEASSKPTTPQLSRSPSRTEKELEKIYAIQQACGAGDRAALVELAISPDGLISDEVRRAAWPILLGYQYQFPDSHHGTKEDSSKSTPSRTLVEDLPPHGDEDQVQLDVNRSFIYYPTNMSPRQLNRRKKELSNLILEVLRKHPNLCYFQGFHDICQVFLLVLGPVHAVVAVEHISLLRIRDFMLHSMAPALDHLHLLYPLLYSVDPKLCSHLSRTQPFFALAATLTLYAHDIQEYSNIARLFDALLAMDPVFPLYLFAEIVLQRRPELFDIPDDEPEMLHSVLSKLPKPLDLEGLISRTILLLKKYPPESLPAWRRVSSKSVLKTSRQPLSSASNPPGNHITLAEAETLFKSQSRQLDRAKYKKELLEMIIKYKGTAAVFGLTAIVGFSAIGMGFYMRKNGGNLDFSSLLVGSSLRRLFATIRS